MDIVAFDVIDAVSDDVGGDVDGNDGEDRFGSLTALCYHFREPARIDLSITLFEMLRQTKTSKLSSV